jgi:hypothetical protein
MGTKYGEKRTADQRNTQDADFALSTQRVNGFPIVKTSRGRCNSQDRWYRSFRYAGERREEEERGGTCVNIVRTQWRMMNEEWSYQALLPSYCRCPCECHLHSKDTEDQH